MVELVNWEDGFADGCCAVIELSMRFRGRMMMSRGRSMRRLTGLSSFRESDIELELTFCSGDYLVKRLTETY